MLAGGGGHRWRSSGQQPARGGQIVRPVEIAEDTVGRPLDEVSACALTTNQVAERRLERQVEDGGEERAADEHRVPGPPQVARQHNRRPGVGVRAIGDRDQVLGGDQWMVYRPDQDGRGGGGDRSDPDLDRARLPARGIGIHDGDGFIRREERAHAFGLVAKDDDRPSEAGGDRGGEDAVEGWRSTEIDERLVAAHAPTASSSKDEGDELRVRGFSHRHDADGPSLLALRSAAHAPHGQAPRKRSKA